MRPYSRISEPRHKKSQYDPHRVYGKFTIWGIFHRRGTKYSGCGNDLTVHQRFGHSEGRDWLS